MPLIAAIRQTEQWTSANIAGAVFLLALTLAAAWWLIRRYLRE